jgi:hypothetical protein
MAGHEETARQEQVAGQPIPPVVRENSPIIEDYGVNNQQIMPVYSIICLTYICLSMIDYLCSQCS